MKKSVIDNITELITFNEFGDEFEAFNKYVRLSENRFSFSEAQYLIGVIRLLLKTDARILRKTTNIIKERG